MTTDNSVKKYLFQNNQWVISASNDPGIIRTMADIGVALVERINRFNVKSSYWYLTDEQFQKIRHILDGSGYSIYEGGSNTGVAPSASFRAPAPVSEPVPNKAPVNPPPSTNPIRIPSISQKDPAAAHFFAQNHTYSISEFNNDFKAGLASAFPLKIWVSGEISGFNVQNGNAYLTLVESMGKTNAADDKKTTYLLATRIWKPVYNTFLKRMAAGTLPKLENGQKIRVAGTVDFYSNGGIVTFIVKDIDDTFALGEFIRQKQRILEELKRLNLHETNKRLPMPALPLRLAIFTKTKSNNSDEAAGWGDFQRIISEPGFPFQITTFSIAVQGKNVESEFLGACDMLEKIGTDKFDLAIVLRGGGSPADLAWFDNLQIAKRIATMPLKFVIAIGHEKDWGVLDDIAYRTPTPSKAAEMLITICTNHAVTLAMARDEIVKRAESRMANEKTRLSQIAGAFSNQTHQFRQTATSELRDLKSEVIQKASAAIQEERFRIRKLASDLQNAEKDCRNDAQKTLSTLQNAVSNSAHSLCRAQAGRLEIMQNSIRNAASNRIDKARTHLDQSIAILAERSKSTREKQQCELDNLKFKLDALNPESLLSRGFVMVSDKDGNRISSARDVKQNDAIHIRLIDGRIVADIREITCDSDKQ